MFGMHHGFTSFGTHNAVFLGLIALAAGYWVSSQAKTDSCCGKWGKFLGGLITVVSLAGLACIGYLTIKSCGGAKCDVSDHDKMMQMMAPEAPAGGHEGHKK